MITASASTIANSNLRADTLSLANPDTPHRDIVAEA